MNDNRNKETILIKDKWINGDNDTIIRLGTKDSGKDLIVFYTANGYPGWRVNEGTTLDVFKRGYLNGTIQRSVIVETEDDVNALIPGGYSTITG